MCEYTPTPPIEATDDDSPEPMYLYGHHTEQHPDTDGSAYAVVEAQGSDNEQFHQAEAAEGQ